MATTFDACKDRGNACFRSQDYTGALVWYDKCVSTDPASPVAHSNRAICLIKLGRGLEAQAACQEGLERLQPLPATPELHKIRQKLLYRLQLAQQLLPQQEWHEIPIRQLDELPAELAAL
ncbi:hypothetical protein HG536_0A09000 [Torulaspora globosa]|uniref:Uncharacterized protein n=1 Tax=Torulaspora globosa TaxID=48254 RepID=A0A7G3ZC47_9SACH|nr:uncharacterized protein HG536_0A09000 [Torulaspora globosa]QLL31083.1 hypothetical protein HG536_0A09000 [Torulaspora globosa]